MHDPLRQRVLRQLERELLPLSTTKREGVLRPRALLCTLDLALVDRLREQFSRVAEGIDVVGGVADALAASPIWEGVRDPVVVARSRPVPMIGVFGRFDEASEARLSTVVAGTPKAMQRLQYLGYPEAQAAVETLAERLVERFGDDGLAAFDYVAIPRGGFVVLGLLAAALGLDRGRLTNQGHGPLLVVDDCSLTGHRFGQFLERHRGREVVFAHLYSHPELRRAIIEREDQVTDCLAAHDLRDWAPEAYGDAYDAWRSSWSERAREPRYWIGLPDAVCFPWTEPERPLWNPVTQQLESGWRVVPPELQLARAASRAAVPVQRQPDPAERIAPTPTVLYADYGDRVIVAGVDRDAAIELDGVAARMWRALVATTSLDAAAATVAGEYATDPDVVRRDLEGFAASLMDRGYLMDQGHVA